MSFENTPRELSCPNCGAPYTLPEFGNQVVCAHCRSHFIVPESVRPAVVYIPNVPQTTSLDTPSYDPTQVRRWIRWLVIFIIVTTVVPVVCGVGAAICGVLAPLVGMFAAR